MASGTQTRIVTPAFQKHDIANKFKLLTMPFNLTHDAGLSPERVLLMRECHEFLSWV